MSMTIPPGTKGIAIPFNKRFAAPDLCWSLRPVTAHVGILIKAGHGPGHEVSSLSLPLICLTLEAA